MQDNISLVPVDLQAASTEQQADAAPGVYRRPALHDLGALEQVQAYYTGRYRDGPRSSYWYNG